MSSTAIPYRDRLIEVIGTLSSGAEQLAYQEQVPIAYVPDELVCQFFDDSFHPKSPEFTGEFSNDELKAVCVFSGYLSIASDEVQGNRSPPITDVLKLPRWREMMRFAAKTTATLKERANKPWMATPTSPIVFDAPT